MYLHNQSAVNGNVRNYIQNHENTVEMNGATMNIHKTIIYVDVIYLYQ